MNITKKTIIAVSPNIPEEREWWDAEKSRLKSEGYKLNDTSSTVCWIATREQTAWFELSKTEEGKLNVKNKRKKG